MATLTKIGIGIFAVALMLIGGVFAATAGVSLSLNNSQPTIVSVTPPAAVDPTECATSAIGAILVNASDSDGYADISLASSYVNITKGAVTYTAGTCVQISASGPSIEMSCTGASFNYTDVAGAWTLTAHVQDVSGGVANASTTLTLNSGVLMRANNAPITFGTVYAGSTDNVNTNSPGFNLENCGNVALNNSITGAAITDGGTNSIAATQFRMDDDATPSGGDGGNDAELTLTTGAQAFNKVGGFAVGSTFNLWSFLNVPTGQAKATYNVGQWTFTPSAA